MVSSNSQETWATCVPGELSRLSTAAKRKHQQKRVIGAVSAIVAGTACVLLLVGNSGLLPDNRIDSQQTNFVANSYSCGDVLERTDRYLLGQLDAEQSQLVRTHLEHCRRCQVAYRGRADELKVEFVVMVPPTYNYFCSETSELPGRGDANQFLTQSVLLLY